MPLRHPQEPSEHPAHSLVSLGVCWAALNIPSQPRWLAQGHPLQPTQSLCFLLQTWDWEPARKLGQLCLLVISLLSPSPVPGQVPTPLQPQERAEEVWAGELCLSLGTRTPPAASLRSQQSSQEHVIGIATLPKGSNVPQQPPAWCHADEKAMTKEQF